MTPDTLMSLDQLLTWVPAGSQEESLARQVDFGRMPAHVAITSSRLRLWFGK